MTKTKKEKVVDLKPKAEKITGRCKYLFKK